MGVGAGLYMCDVVVKSSRSLSDLLMSSCSWPFYNAEWTEVLHFLKLSILEHEICVNAFHMDAYT